MSDPDYAKAAELLMQKVDTLREEKVKMAARIEELEELLEEVLVIYGEGFSNINQRHLVIRIKNTLPKQGESK